MQQGNGPTWHGWPEEFRHPQTDAVRAFAEEQRELVTFHTWLQWLADRQLAEAQARALARGPADRPLPRSRRRRRAGRLGHLVRPRPRRPDRADRRAARLFQRERPGLGPRAALARRARGAQLRALSRVRSTPCVHHAGALRIDHAMSLFRLFWIAENFGAADGVYVRYPFHAMLKTLAAVSQARHTIIIGEDLGVVPEGFRAGDAEDRDPELSRLLLRKDRRRVLLSARSTIRARRSPASPSTTSTRSPAGGAATTSTCARRSA